MERKQKTKRRAKKATKRNIQSPNQAIIFKALREKLGLTQSQFGKVVGLHPQFISNIERAKCQVPASVISFYKDTPEIVTSLIQARVYDWAGSILGFSNIKTIKPLKLTKKNLKALESGKRNETTSSAR